VVVQSYLTKRSRLALQTGIQPIFLKRLARRDAPLTTETMICPWEEEQYFLNGVWGAAGAGQQPGLKPQPHFSETACGQDDPSRLRTSSRVVSAMTQIGMCVKTAWRERKDTSLVQRASVGAAVVNEIAHGK
jgi:hypothetical protein